MHLDVGLVLCNQAVPRLLWLSEHIVVHREVVNMDRKRIEFGEIHTWFLVPASRFMLLSFGVVCYTALVTVAD